MHVLASPANQNAAMYAARSQPVVSHVMVSVALPSFSRVTQIAGSSSDRRH